MGRKAKYFGKDEEQMIIEFNKAYDFSVKRKIFEKYLKDAFYRMIESILNRYRLYDNTKTYQNMLDDCMGYVYERIEKFDNTRRKCTENCTKKFIYDVDICPYCKAPTRGFKAYSFFGTIIKRYFISERTKNKVSRMDSIETNDNTTEEYIELNTHVIQDEEEDYEKNEFFLFLNNYLKRNKSSICVTDEDNKLFDSFIIILQRPADVSFYNKKYIYILLKELTGISEQLKINTFINNLTEYYIKAKKEYWG